MIINMEFGVVDCFNVYYCGGTDLTIPEKYTILPPGNMLQSPGQPAPRFRDAILDSLARGIQGGQHCDLEACQVLALQFGGIFTCSTAIWRHVYV